MFSSFNLKIKKGGNIVICLTTGCIFKWIPFFGMIQESIRKQIKWGDNNNLFYEPRSLWGVLDTTLCDKVCQWLSSNIPVSSMNKTDRNDITEILLKVALNTITLTPMQIYSMMLKLLLLTEIVYFFFWPLCCLFFFDIRILITPLVSSNSSSNIEKCIK